MADARDEEASQAMTCVFCKTSAYGCTPGRCFSPRSRTDDEVVKPSDPKPLAPPLGPKRIVISSHRRAGPNGGLFWVLELECMHIVWRRGIKRAPKSETCVGCGKEAIPFTASCACGCGTVAELDERFRRWWWKNGAWYAPGHERVEVGVSRIP